MYGSRSKIKYSRVTTGPEVEPVDRDTIVKSGLKLGAAELVEDEALLDLLIQASREDIEEKTGRSLITQEREIKLDYFPCFESLYLTFGPVQSVEAVKYYDSDEVEQTLDSDLYWVDTHSTIARIVIKNSWPATKTRPNAITVEYTAGYGDTAAEVPAPLRSAVLSGVGWYYENRDQPIPHELVDPLIWPYIVNQDVSY
jgi:uncharacterized phiE125 gp8 family phage protein